MRVAVLGTSPIMLIAARYLAMHDHSVEIYEARPHVGGAWIAPGLQGLKHRHANLIVAYNHDDHAALEHWRDFLFNQMNMHFKVVPHSQVKLTIEYHSAFDPDFINAYSSLRDPIYYFSIEGVVAGTDYVRVDGQDFDYLLLPAFNSLNSIVVNGTEHELPFNKTTSVHAICEDRDRILDYVYREGTTHLFDRYFKSMETGVFVARIEKAIKALPRDEIISELEKRFLFKDIAEYTSFYRNADQFNELKRIAGISGGRVIVMDTRQFCWGLKDVSALGNLLG